MGYRTYLSSIPKTVWLEYKDKTEDELGEDFYVNELPDLKELYEIGKAWDFEVDKHTSRFFTHEMEWESDMEFSVANKEFLIGIIENYKEKIISYHQDLHDNISVIEPNVLREYKLNRIIDKDKLPENETDQGLDKVKQYFNEKIWEWKQLIPYNLDVEDPTITSSWKFEYVIFELVRIYKTFDWENNLLIWSGH